MARVARFYQTTVGTSVTQIVAYSPERTALLIRNISGSTVYISSLGHGRLKNCRDHGDKTKMKIGTSLTKILKLIIGTRSYIGEINGDMWVAANATWDGTNWNRLDTSKYAFALQLCGYNNIPGKTEQGVIVWKAAPGANPIGAYYTSGGWEPVYIGRSDASFIVSGEEVKIEGLGTTYGASRLICLGDGLHLTHNAYWDGTNWKADASGKWATDIWLTVNGYVQIRQACPGGSTIYWKNGVPAKARAYLSSSGQGLLADTPTKVHLNMSSWDIWDWFDDDTSYRFTVPEKIGEGEYLVTAGVTFAAAGSDATVTAEIRKNTTAWVTSIQHQRAGMGSLTVCLSDIVSLLRNDYIELWAKSSIDGDLVGGSKYTWLSIAKIL